MTKVVLPDPEAGHMIKVVQWLERATGQVKWWFHVPNEGAITEARGARLKKQGVKSGVSDFIFLRPANGYHFLAVELKPNRTKRVTPAQLEFIAEVKREGGWGQVTYGSKETIEYIAEFYGLPTLGFTDW